MAPLNEADAANPARLRQQVMGYLAASNVPSGQRETIADRVLSELPEGLDGPHLWLSVQRLIDRVLARVEGLGSIHDPRLLTRARLGYVLAPEGARHALPESEPALGSPLAEGDRFSVPRPVPHQMRPQPIQFWSPEAAKSLKRRFRFGSRLNPGA